MNGAEYLLYLFEVEERPDGFDTSACVAFKAMSDTEQMADRLRTLRVKRLDTAMKQMPRIWSQLMRSYGAQYTDGRYNDFSPQLHHVEELDDACMLALETIADRWIAPQLDTGAVDRTQIDAAVKALINLLQDDKTLPDRLKVYVLSLVQHVRSILERLDAGVEVDLDASLKELLAAFSVRCAPAISSPMIRRRARACLDSAPSARESSNSLRMAFLMTATSARFAASNSSTDIGFPFVVFITALLPRTRALWPQTVLAATPTGELQPPPPTR